jgi:tetratricopeptide (TPR) repeat protein
MENLGWALGNLAFYAEASGTLASQELGDAGAAALEALRIADDLGSAFSRAVALAQRGLLHLLAGEWDLAEALYGDALDIMRSRRIRLETECLDLARLARAQLGNGKLAAARATAEEAVALARERGQRVWELIAQITFVDSLAAERGGKWRTMAEQALARAAELIQETQAHTYEPQIAEVRARLARASGDGAAAERHLRDAHRLYARIGASGHTQRVAAALDGGAR